MGFGRVFARAVVDYSGAVRVVVGWGVVRVVVRAAVRAVVRAVGPASAQAVVQGAAQGVGLSAAGHCD